MNQDQVKAALESLEVSIEDFTVIFSGKASKRVNGLYKPATKEILIHNKNFENDQALMVTAIHELVHHIVITRNLVKSKTAHPIAFWALFHSLLKIAVNKGVYKDPFDSDPELQAQGEAILGILKAQFELEQKLGSALNKMQDLCSAKGARFEDYLDRHARIPRAEAKAAMKSTQIQGPQKASPQAVNLVFAFPAGPEQQEAFKMVAEGASIAQVKAAVKQKVVINPQVDPGEEQTLEDRLQDIEKKLAKKRAAIATLQREAEDLAYQLDNLQKQNRFAFDSPEVA